VLPKRKPPRKSRNRPTSAKPLLIRKRPRIKKNSARLKLRPVSVKSRNVKPKLPENHCASNSKPVSSSA